MPTDPDLLTMRVVGPGSLFQAPPAKQRRNLHPLPKELWMVSPDPLDLTPQSVPRSFGEVGVGAAGNGGAEFLGAMGGLGDDGRFSDLSSDTDAQDLREDLAGEGLDFAEGSFGDPALAEDDKKPTDVSQDDFHSTLEAAADEDEIPKPPTVAEAIAATTISATGYVSCSLGPWSSTPLGGEMRLGLDVPPIRQRRLLQTCAVFVRQEARGS